MSFQPAKVAAVYVNGYDGTNYFDEYTAGPFELRNEETQHFGDNSKSRLTVMADSHLSLRGFYDKTAGGGHDIIKAAIGTGVDHVAVLPEGTAFEKEAVCVQAKAGSIQEGSPVLGVIRTAAEFNGDGDHSIGIVLHPKTAEAVSFDGSVHDGGAASAAGAVAWLQVFAAAGATLDVIVEQSATGAFAGEESTLLSFTQVTGAPVFERVEVSGAVARYIRASGTIAGGSFTVFVAFERK